MPALVAGIHAETWLAIMRRGTTPFQMLRQSRVNLNFAPKPLNPLEMAPASGIFRP